MVKIRHKSWDKSEVNIGRSNPFKGIKEQLDLSFHQGLTLNDVGIPIAQFCFLTKFFKSIMHVHT